jgi:hypothetical protein
MIERSERIGQVVELLGAEGYEPFVYDQGTESFRPFGEQQAVNVFFLSTDRGPARIRRR